VRDNVGKRGLLADEVDLKKIGRLLK